VPLAERGPVQDNAEAAQVDSLQNDKIGADPDLFRLKVDFDLFEFPSQRFEVPEQLQLGGHRCRLLAATENVTCLLQHANELSQFAGRFLVGLPNRSMPVPPPRLVRSPEGASH
jgi:hypothetical protein